MAYIRKRIGKAGKVTYRAEVSAGALAKKTATFDKYGDAKEWAAKVEAELKAGKYRFNPAAERRTMADLIDQYIATVLIVKSRKQRYIEQQRVQLLWWRGVIGSYTMAMISPFVIAECRDKLLAGARGRKVTGATANRYIAALNHVFNTACKEWGWIETNPIQRVSKMQESRGRIRYLTDKERHDLLAACARVKRLPLHLIVVFALCTGARKNEILTLKVKDVDFARNIAVVYDTKNGEPRQLYLWDYLARQLKEWVESDERKPRRSEFVFPGKHGGIINIETPWRGALRAARVNDFRFHDLRHTSASYMAMNGASPADIAEALGHKSLNLVKRYAHLSQTHVAAVVTSMNEKVFSNQLEGLGT